MEKVLKQIRSAFPQIIGKQIILRKLEEDDTSILSHYMLDDRVRKFISFREGVLRTPSKLFHYFEESYERLRDVHFVVTLPLFSEYFNVDYRAEADKVQLVGDSVIGLCSLQFLDKVTKQAKLGYFIAPQFWNKGYATEAARLVLSFGFSALNLSMIEARCQVGNLASESVLKKCGMVKTAEYKTESNIKYHLWRTHAISL